MRGKKSVQNRVILLSIIFVCLVFLVLSLSSVIAVPFGAGTVTEENNTWAPADVPDSHDAFAGNVTELIISGYSTTNTWQGYYGNVTGVIQLADSADNVMYNWSDTNPEGEVYASTNDSIDWYYIQCFNHTADGTYGDDTAQAGATSLYGMNHTQLQENFNIELDDPDAVNNSFAFNVTEESHPLFYTNSFQFDAGECMSIELYNSTGVGDFYEILMYEPTGQSVIFNSILKRDANGFDNRLHDFEMLVLDDAHGIDLAPTTYYFYIELGA